MSMTIPVAAARIARKFHATERSLDLALQNASALLCELATVRAEADVEASAGQAAFVRLAKAQSLLVEVQSEVLRSHAVLRDFAQERADIPDVCPTLVVPPSQVAA